MMQYSLMPVFERVYQQADEHVLAFLKAPLAGHMILRDTAPAAESCPNCNGLGTLDEPHLPGGNCPICRGSGLRDTALV